MRKKSCVSVGYENIVAERIREINSIIKKNSTSLIKNVIRNIAKVSIGVWYTYFSKGAQRGRISNTAVKALKNFFVIPEDVFAGKAEFTNEHREIIAFKIKTVFGSAIDTKQGPKRKAGRPRKIKETVEKANVKNPSSIEARLREFAHEIDGIKELKQMNRLAETLAKLSNIANKKTELLAALNSL